MREIQSGTHEGQTILVIVAAVLVCFIAGYWFVRSSSSRLINIGDKPELISHTDNLKALFQIDGVATKDSFLEHFHSKIINTIRKPYIEDLQENMSVTYSNSDRFLIVEDTIAYKCRKVGKYIQDIVEWSHDPGRIEELLDFKITIQIPESFFQLAKFQNRYPEISSHPILFERLDERLVEIDKGIGFKLSLSDYREIDGLYIKIHAKYVVNSDSYLVLRMGHPSNRLLLSFIYPQDLELSIDTFGIPPSDLEVEARKGFHIVKYNSWLLPYNGFAYQFRSKQTP